MLEHLQLSLKVPTKGTLAFVAWCGGTPTESLIVFIACRYVPWHLLEGIVTWQALAPYFELSC